MIIWLVLGRPLPFPQPFRVAGTVRLGPQSVDRRLSAWPANAFDLSRCVSASSLSLATPHASQHDPPLRVLVAPIKDKKPRRDEVSVMGRFGRCSRLSWCVFSVWRPTHWPSDVMSNESSRLNSRIPQSTAEPKDRGNLCAFST